MSSVLQQEPAPSSHATSRLDVQTAEELSLHEKIQGTKPGQTCQLRETQLLTAPRGRGAHPFLLRSCPWWLQQRQAARGASSKTKRFVWVLFPNS